MLGGRFQGTDLQHVFDGKETADKQDGEDNGQDFKVTVNKALNGRPEKEEKRCHQKKTQRPADQ